MKYTIYCLLAALCLAGKGLAQGVHPPVKPLTVGDTLPDMLISNLYNYPAASTRLSSFAGKYILLDFWSTQCSSCLAAISHLHTLQEQYRDQLQVLLVNSYARDTKAKAAALFKKRLERTGQAVTLPYVLQDSLLAAYFPHRTIPHYVWLDKGGRVAAITDADALMETNVSPWLAGERLQLPVKNDDLLFDPARDRLVNKDSGFLCRSIITVYQPALGYNMGRETDSNGLISRVYLVNCSLLTLYQWAFPAVLQVPISQIIVDKSIAGYFGQSHGTARRLFCYELQGRPLDQAELESAMQADLLRCFNITACSEERVMDCYILGATDRVSRAFSKGGKPADNVDSLSIHPVIRNSRVSSLLAVLGTHFNGPWVDETGLRQNIDIVFPPGFFRYSLQQVKDFLLGYGLLITPAKRSLTVAVLQPTRAAE